MNKKSKLGILLAASLLFLTACGTSQVTADSNGFWEKLVYFFAEIIRFLSFNGSTGIGIILFTLIIRTVLLPVFQFQTTSSRKMQEVEPRIREIQEKYPGRDMESRTALSEETQKLYREMGVNPLASFIPLFVQLPVLMALFQALTRVEFLKTGHFLWLNLGETDPTFILPVLAALFTFLSTWLSNKALPERNGSMTVMMYVMPVAIFFFTMYAASGVALYWTVSNAYQVAQTLLLSNPFKIIAEREAKEREERQLELRKQRALRKAQKKKR